MMIIKLREGSTPAQKEEIIAQMREMALDAHEIAGKAPAIACLGEVHGAAETALSALTGAGDILHVDTPYYLAGRAFQLQDTVVSVGAAKIGAGHFALLAGPCSVESEAQVTAIARAVKASGAGLLRGGAFKPRTSPYAFSGLQAEGLRLLAVAKAQTGLPVVSEIMETSQLPLFEAVDVIQVGARNMQNFALLRALGEIRKPVLLKRGLSNTLDELLMSAEYILAGGNDQVILCERGIRTFETHTRNTLDLSAVPQLKAMTHLPVIVDPSHGTGVAALVRPMALAAVAAGADGVMIEVHDNPACALCDGEQSLTPSAFDDVARAALRIRAALMDEE